MANEGSFLDRYQKGRDLEAAIETFTPEYDAEDPDFSAESLGEALDAAHAANTAHDEASQPWTDSVADRQALLKQINPLVTQSLAYVKSKTVWASRYESVKKAADKVRGVRKPAKPMVPDGTTDKKREQGQRGYMEIGGFLRQYLSRLQKLTGYAPSSPAISLANLTSLSTTFDALNENIPKLEQTLSDAAGDRRKVYDKVTGLHYVFLGVKTAVKAQYGQSSQEYNQVKGIKW